MTILKRTAEDFSRERLFMDKPQQANVKDADHLAAGEIRWEVMAFGYHRVRYRRLDGVTLSPFKGSADDAFKFFLECQQDIRAELSRLSTEKAPPQV